MAGENRYVLPDEVLPAITIEVAGAQPLVGLISQFDIVASGVHQVFPYCTYLNTHFGTYTIVREQPGSIRFGGFLVATTATIQSLFGGLGDTVYAATHIRIINPDSLDVLANWDAWDYRLGGMQLRMQLMANHTMVKGVFTVSYRKLVGH